MPATNKAPDLERPAGRNRFDQMEWAGSCGFDSPGTRRQKMNRTSWFPAFFIALSYALLAAVPAAAAAPAAAGAVPQAGVKVELGKEKGSISTAWFERVMKENPGALLVVDIRDPKEYAAGTIKGAVNIPMAELAQKIGSLPADQVIVFVCSTGARSGEAYDTAKLLRPDLNVYFLDARVRYGGGGTYSIVL